MSDKQVTKYVKYAFVGFSLVWANVINAELIDNGDGTVTQIRADGIRLMWLKDAGYLDAMGVDEAQQYLSEVDISGYSDWRLPKVYPVEYYGSYRDKQSELNNLYYEELNLATYSGAASVQGPFENINSGAYWTSSPASEFVPSASDQNVFYFTFIDEISPNTQFNNEGMGAAGNKYLSANIWPVRDVSGVPVLSCNGFASPMDRPIVKAKKNRALPHKAELYDSNGYLMTNMDITAPAIQILYSPTNRDEAVEDVTELALAAGAGTEGNTFIFNEDSYWQYNLKIKNYTSKGTYTVSIVSGDDQEYVIEPRCSAVFVIE